MILGVSDESIKPKLTELFAPFSNRIEWMSIESAEMTKHAINAFLATSVTFANELARLCEAVGANAKEVERGLKSEGRIGPKAYLSPGGAFAGGTLARDLRFLTQFGRKFGVETPLFEGVIAGNERHKDWTRDKVRQLLHGRSSRRSPCSGSRINPEPTRFAARPRSSCANGCTTAATASRRMIQPSRNCPETFGPQSRLPLHHAKPWAAPTWRSSPPNGRVSQPDRDGFPLGDASPRRIDPNWFLAGILSDERKIHYITTGRDRPADEK